MVRKIMSEVQRWQILASGFLDHMLMFLRVIFERYLIYNISVDWDVRCKISPISNYEYQTFGMLLFRLHV